MIATHLIDKISANSCQMFAYCSLAKYITFNRSIDVDTFTLDFQIINRGKCNFFYYRFSIDTHSYWMKNAHFPYRQAVQHRSRFNSNESMMSPALEEQLIKFNSIYTTLQQCWQRFERKYIIRRDVCVFEEAIGKAASSILVIAIGWNVIIYKYIRLRLFLSWINHHLIYLLNHFN